MTLTLLDSVLILLIAQLLIAIGLSIDKHIIERKFIRKEHNEKVRYFQKLRESIEDED